MFYNRFLHKTAEYLKIQNFWTTHFRKSAGISKLMSHKKVTSHCEAQQVVVDQLFLFLYLMRKELQVEFNCYVGVYEFLVLRTIRVP